MSDFRTQLRLRTRQAERSLAEALEAGDHYLAEIQLGELESLQRVAADHQVSLDDAAESLAG